MVDSKIIENVTHLVQIPSTFSNASRQDSTTSWYQYMFSLVLPDTQMPGGYANFSINDITTRVTYQSLKYIIPHSQLQGTFSSQAFSNWQWQIIQTISVQLSVMDETQWMNISQLVASLAHDINISLRRSALSFATDISQWQGETWEQETRVHIRWAWIILPTCLLIFSFSFLVITIIKSEKNDKIGIWKSSALAVLVNGLGEDVQDYIGRLSNLGHARGKARQLHVQLNNK
jgi:hypothetical protein